MNLQDKIKELTSLKDLFHQNGPMKYEESKKIAVDKLLDIGCKDQSEVLSKIGRWDIFYDEPPFYKERYDECMSILDKLEKDFMNQTIYQHISSHSESQVDSTSFLKLESEMKELESALFKEPLDKQNEIMPTLYAFKRYLHDIEEEKQYKENKELVSSMLTLLSYNTELHTLIKSIVSKLLLTSLS